MQEATLRALRVLDAITGAQGREERLTELLRDPESGETPGWFMHVPAPFNDALDIRQTARMVDGKTVPTWTQGSSFGFSPGDVLYDSAVGYTEWSEALKRISRCIQVTATVDGVRIRFDVLNVNGAKTGLALEANHTLTQSQFVRFLITGGALTESGKQ